MVLTKNIIKINKQSSEKIIEGYTRESGVRGLEKQIAKIIRNVAKCIAMQEDYSSDLKIEDIHKILGVYQFLKINMKIMKLQE